MELNDSIELTKLALLAALLLFCSVTDLSMRRIPNVVLLPTLMTALFLNSIGYGLAGFIDSVAGLAIGILMLMPIHILGRMGAGDIKLLGVVGSVLGAWGAIVAGFATMMAGGVLAVIYMIWLLSKPGVVAQLSRITRRLSGKRQPRFDATSLQSVRVAEIPYAVAVAAGTVATLIYLGLLNGVSVT